MVGPVAGRRSRLSQPLFKALLERHRIGLFRRRRARVLGHSGEAPQLPAQRRDRAAEPVLVHPTILARQTRARPAKPSPPRPSALRPTSGSAKTPRGTLVGTVRHVGIGGAFRRARRAPAPPPRVRAGGGPEPPPGEPPTTPSRPPHPPANNPSPARR